jgi:ribonuclease P/MRP protein subunit RPP1
MSFYEWGVKALPEGSDSPSRLGLAAKRLGYDGIIICNSKPEAIFRPEAAAEIRGIDVSFGAVAAADSPRVLRSTVASLRPNCDFIAACVCSSEMNRAACEDSNIDVTLHSGEKFVLEIAAARAARLNQVAIGVDLSPMIRLRGTARSRWLDALRRNMDLIRKFDLGVMITAGIRSHIDLRTPRDLMALAEIAGFDASEAKEALNLPGRILELNRRNWANPGVEIL